MDQKVEVRRPGLRQGPRTITVLGATGSIGRSTADIICDAGDAFTVAAVAGGRDPVALARMAIRLNGLVRRAR